MWEFHEILYSSFYRNLSTERKFRENRISYSYSHQLLERVSEFLQCFTYFYKYLCDVWHRISPSTSEFPATRGTV